MTVHIPEGMDPLALLEVTDKLIGPRIVQNIKNNLEDMYTRMDAAIAPMVQHKGLQ